MFKPIARIVIPLLLLIVFFVAAGGALAQFDVLYEEDREHLNGDTDEEEDVEEEEADEEPETIIKRPKAETCPEMPEGIVIIGFVAPTQCQQLTLGGIGRVDLIQLGVADAADIWGVVPGSLDICFQQSGYLVFLDAADSPRTLAPLLSFERDGMTCGRIDRPGTVVLLHNPYPFASPLVPASAPEPEADAEAEAASTSVTEAVAESAPNCIVKLTEALFLREAPGGRIIGIVWMNSEVPVYETAGDWYKIDFEGQPGYISRDYSKLLSGDCG